MWRIYEHRDIGKTYQKIPREILKKYEIWKEIVFRHGPEKLRDFPGFRDEKLKGEREGQRSSRLNVQYRVIYKIQRDVVTVFVIEITPHDY